jgi:hypothetical protein
MNWHRGRFCVSLFVGAALLAPLPSAALQKKKPAAEKPEPARIVDARSTWYFDTSSVPKTAEVKKGGLILSLPIYPKKLIRILSPVTDVGTKGVKVSSGKQYFGLELVNGREVFCSTRTLDYMKDGGSIFYMRYTGTFTCLVDQDKDGKLDGEYEIRSRTQSGIPTITHGKDSGYEAVEPIAYEVLDPKAIDHVMWFQVKWCCGDGQDKGAAITMGIYGDKGDASALAGQYPVRVAADAPAQELAGVMVALRPKAKNLMTADYTLTGAVLGLESMGMRARLGPLTQAGR